MLGHILLISLEWYRACVYNYMRNLDKLTIIYYFASMIKHIYSYFIVIETSEWLYTS